MTIQIGEVSARCLALLFSQPIEFIKIDSEVVTIMIGKSNISQP